MDQIIFLNNFVKLYGFNAIDDYETQISISQYKNPQQLIDSVNSHMPTIKKLFKNSQLQLSRKNYQIDSPLLAVSLLKNLLKQANIGYQTCKTQGKNFLRLIHPNNLLRDYIDKKMEYIDPQILKHVESQTSEKTQQDFDEFMVKITPKKVDYKQNSDNYMQNILGTMIGTGIPSISYKTYDNLRDMVFRILEDGRVVIETYFIRGCEIITKPKFKIIGEHNFVEDISELIDQTWLIVGNTIISKNLFAYLPIINIPYQECRMLIFLKKLDIRILNSKIRLSYDAIHLNNEYRTEFKSLSEYCCPLPLYFKNDCLYGTDYYYYNHNGVTNYGTSVYSNKFQVPRYWDGIHNLKFRVKDIYGNNHDELLKQVSIIIRDIDIITKMNMHSGEIHFDEFSDDEFIPICALKYNEINFIWKTWQPLTSEQYVNIEFNYLQLSEEDRNILETTSFKFMYHNLIKNGQIYLIRPSQSNQYKSICDLIKK